MRTQFFYWPPVWCVEITNTRDANPCLQTDSTAVLDPSQGIIWSSSPVRRLPASRANVAGTIRLQVPIAPEPANSAPGEMLV